MAGYSFVQYDDLEELSIVVVEAGSNADAVRPDGAAVVYWKCAAGVTPVNTEPGDIIFNAAA